ncbi:hypothetical protein HMPREF3221_02258 [Fusobacterium nucleatum]|uniref:Uncharacterized protein n=1 Tax=Fusobacterium nucleatum TaxID=851 RepID=A0A133NEP4_FUSNU|nr:hypothetical protein HMPREF3221_02258 [Fusobacterium nucleatum]
MVITGKRKSKKIFLIKKKIINLIILFIFKRERKPIKHYI